VRIDHTGAAFDTGKYDEAVVLAGHRFTFELGLEGEPGDSAGLDWVLDALAAGAVRLGGSTRRGLGQFVVKRLLRRRFDLTNAVDARAYADLPKRLDASNGLAHLDVKPTAPSPREVDGTIALMLRPEGYWFVGGGDPRPTEHDKLPDMNPLRERRVEWVKGRGRLSKEQMVIPGSSVKGALAHRVAYHGNMLLGRFADEGAGLDDPST
jgi:hypothetical protein